MAKLILFSGGCNSGKTTTLLKTKEALIKDGYEVEVVDELIRDQINESIDEIRTKPNKYLELQQAIIGKKIEQELKAFSDTSNKIYLFDRAATDSLFYLESYVDKIRLSNINLEVFCAMHEYIHKYLLDHFKLYTLVIHFEPIDKNQLSLFRPKQLDLLKTYENSCIKRLNYFYSECVAHENLIEVDLNKDEVLTVIDKIRNKLWL